MHDCAMRNVAGVLDVVALLKDSQNEVWKPVDCAGRNAGDAMG
jgi:hypothetical protein